MSCRVYVAYTHFTNVLTNGTTTVIFSKPHICNHEIYKTWGDLSVDFRIKSNQTHSTTMSKTSIAIFGINGALGKPTLEALTSSTFADKFQLPVLAVTRDASKVTSTDQVKYIQGDYITGQAALISELKGIDVIVELLSPNPDVFAATEAIAAAVKPKLYIPTQFGIDIEAGSEVLPGFLGIKVEHADKIRASGIKVVDVYTSLFAEPGSFLYENIASVGGDPAAKKVTYLGSPNTKISFSTLPDVGRVITSLAATPVSEIPQKVRVQSGEVTPAEVVARYEKTHDVKFEVSEISKEQALEDGKKVWAEGFNPSRFLYYLQVLASQGAGKGLSFVKNDNELVNPGEKLWKWSSY